MLAQEAGLSLAAHLAPEPLERVAVNATIGAADVSTALTNVYLAIANGIETIKLKVAHRRVEEDIASSSRPGASATRSSFDSMPTAVGVPTRRWRSCTG